jgi:hypothetical protein
MLEGRERCGMRRFELLKENFGEEALDRELAEMLEEGLKRLGGERRAIEELRAAN